jgi:hypothetical protein
MSRYGGWQILRKASASGARTRDPHLSRLQQLETESTESKVALAHATAALSTAQQHAREAQVRALHDSLSRGFPIESCSMIDWHTRLHLRTAATGHPR